MTRSILISFALILFSISLYSQNTLYKSYEYDNVDSRLKFSLNTPQSWKEIPEYDGTGYFQSFIETDSIGTVIKKHCLDSVIYKLKYFSTAIPQAMVEMGFRNRGNNIFQYELNNFIHIVVGFEMKGNNYQGLNCSFKASLPCESKRSKKKNAE